MSLTVCYSGKINKTFWKKWHISVVDANSCQQKIITSRKHLDFIDNSNTLEEHLGNRKIHLRKRGNSFLFDIFMKYLRSSFLILDDFSCVRDFQAEYGSQQVLASGINGFTNDVSEKSLRVIRQEKLNPITIAHLNINSIRSKFHLLANQITGICNKRFWKTVKVLLSDKVRWNLLKNYISTWGKNNNKWWWKRQDTKFVFFKRSYTSA